MHELVVYQTGVNAQQAVHHETHIHEMKKKKKKSNRNKNLAQVVPSLHQLLSPPVCLPSRRKTKNLTQVVHPLPPSLSRPVTRLHLSLTRLLLGKAKILCQLGGFLVPVTGDVTPVNSAGFLIASPIQMRRKPLSHM